MARRDPRQRSTIWKPNGRRSLASTMQPPFKATASHALSFNSSPQKGLVKPVVALARSPDGRPVALFVMMRSRRHGLRWLLTEARPIDYCSPIFDSSLEEADLLARSFRPCSRRFPRVDLLYCNRMPERFEGTGPTHSFACPMRVVFGFQPGRSNWRAVARRRSLQPVLPIFGPTFADRTQKLAQAHRRVFSLAIGRRNR